MTNTIKPCPFCGNTAWLMNTMEHDCTDDPPACFVICNDCLAEGPRREITNEAIETRAEMKKIERAAIKAWNRRTTSL